MEKTEMTLIEKLNYIQNELKAPKELRNSFGNYNYRSAESILEAVKPLLNKTGTVIVISDELVLIGDRYYVKAIATIQDNSGDVTVTAYAREEQDKKGMDSAQITGATSSYARKYALNGLLLIDDTKDPDSYSPENKPASTAAKAAPAKPLAPAKTNNPKPATPPVSKPAETKTSAAKVETAKAPVQKPTSKEVEATEDQKKALAAFKALDESKVLAHIINNEKILKYVSIEKFVMGEPIDKVREVYSKVQKLKADKK